MSKPVTSDKGKTRSKGRGTAWDNPSRPSSAPSDGTAWMNPHTPAPSSGSTKRSMGTGHAYANPTSSNDRKAAQQAAEWRGMRPRKTKSNVERIG